MFVKYRLLLYLSKYTFKFICLTTSMNNLCLPDCGAPIGELNDIYKETRDKYLNIISTWANPKKTNDLNLKLNILRYLSTQAQGSESKKTACSVFKYYISESNNLYRANIKKDKFEIPSKSSVIEELDAVVDNNMIIYIGGQVSELKAKLPSILGQKLRRRNVLDEIDLTCYYISGNGITTYFIKDKVIADILQTKSKENNIQIKEIINTIIEEKKGVSKISDIRKSVISQYNQMYVAGFLSSIIDEIESSIN